MASSAKTPAPNLPVETAEAQMAMLTEMVKASEPDAEGRVLVQRDHLIDCLEKIRSDHRRELQALPTIAGRMISVFGVTM